MRRDYGLIALCLCAALALAFLWGCATRNNFDRWIAQQPITIINGPVPCDRFPTQCGSTGLFDSSRNTIYLDPVAIASLQAVQNQYDPTVNVHDLVYYHEWSHVADRAAGYVEGVGLVQFEHAAQCGMQLATSRSYTFFANPSIYWICPDAELARTRWIWTAKGII